MSRGRWQLFPTGIDRETKAGRAQDGAGTGRKLRFVLSQVKSILMTQTLPEKNITRPRAGLRQRFSPEALTPPGTRHVSGATVEVIFSGNFPPRQGTLTALAWVKLPFNRSTPGSVAPGSLPASPVGCEGVVPHLGTFRPVPASGEGRKACAFPGQGNRAGWTFAVQVIVLKETT